MPSQADSRKEVVKWQLTTPFYDATTCSGGSVDRAFLVKPVLSFRSAISWLSTPRDRHKFTSSAVAWLTAFTVSLRPSRCTAYRPLSALPA